MQQLGIKASSVKINDTGHYAIKSDQLKRVVVTSASPSDKRTNLNLKAELKGQMHIPPAKKHPKRIDPEIKVKILNESFSGVSVGELVIKYGVGKSTIGKWKTAEKGIIKNQTNHYTAEIKNNIVKLIESGVTVAEACKPYGIKANTAYTWCKAYKKHGEFKDKVNKPVIKEGHGTAAKNATVSLITPGRTRDDLPPPKFRESLSILSALVEHNEKLELENDVLRTELKLLKKANDDDKTRLKLIAETLNDLK